MTRINHLQNEKDVNGLGSDTTAYNKHFVDNKQKSYSKWLILSKLSWALL